MARNYSIELLPQQQQKTDAEFFVDALIPTYERQNKQIDQNYNNTIEQARQAYEADPGVERLENWKAVIKFAADNFGIQLIHKNVYDMDDNEMLIPDSVLKQAYSEIDQAIYEWENEE